MRKVFFLIPILFIWAYAQVDHFEFANISSPQNVDTRFPITIYAKDASNNTVTSFNADVPIQTNHGSVIDVSKVLFDHGTANYNLEARLAANDMVLTVTFGSATGSSNSFVVNRGVLNRVQLLMPGEVATPGISPGKTGDPKSQQASIPVDSVIINATDKWWNVEPNTITVTLSSPNDTNAVFNNPHSVPGTQLTTLTFKTVACPLPKPAIVRDTVFATSTGLQSDRSAVIVVSGPYEALLQILPGEKNEPGTNKGKSGVAVVTAYKQFIFPVYACDAAWNEIDASSIPAGHRVTTWCNIGEGKYKTDTLIIKSGGDTMHVTLYPEPGSGPVHYSIRAVDLDSSAANSYDTDITVNRVPDSLIVTAEKDTVVLGIDMDITASAFGGGKSYPNTQIHFQVLPVEGSGTLSDTTGTTSGAGTLKVTFTGKQPGAVYVKAWSELDPTVMDSVRVVVVTKERISFYPNPWSRTKIPTATILYTLESDVSSVSLLIADVSGNIVKKVEYKEPDIQTLSGPHYIVWDGKNMKGEKVASGMYVIRVRATGEESFKRSALLLP